MASYGDQGEAGPLSPGASPAPSLQASGAASRLDFKFPSRGPRSGPFGDARRWGAGSGAAAAIAARRPRSPRQRGRTDPPPGPAAQLPLPDATPRGPLLTFDAVPPCPGAPRKARPPPGFFDLSGEAPVRRLSFAAGGGERSSGGDGGSSERAAGAGAGGAPPQAQPQQHQHGAQQHRIQQQQQQMQHAAALAAAAAGLGAAADDAAAASASPAQPPPPQQPHCAGQRAGPVLARPQRPQHQRHHPYQLQLQAPGAAAAAAADLASPTAIGVFASPPVAKPKRAPATPVRLFR
jgi:hypothetical protein